MWHPMVQAIDYDISIQAVHMHFAESDRYLLPVHVVANARRIAQERMTHRKITSEDYRESPSFVPDPKPANLAEMTAAWDDPVRFGIEVAKYRQQVADYHARRRAHATAGYDESELV